VSRTYIIEGGIGKQVCFTACIEKLAKRDKCGVQIYSPHYEIFSNNPNVSLVLDAKTIPINDERITNTDIVFVEPYKSNMIKGEKHLLESYCELLGIKYTSKMKPKLYTGFLKKQAEELLDEHDISDNFIVCQFTGGQSAPNTEEHKKWVNPLGLDFRRDYPTYFANKVIDDISKDYQVLFFGLPNEPAPLNAIRIDTNYMVWAEIIKKAKGFIAVDSLLQHIAAAVNTKGVVIWGSTRFNQFGYKQNTNLNYWMTDKWDEGGFDQYDPRNILVDPDNVTNEFYKLNNNDIITYKPKEIVNV